MKKYNIPAIVSNYVQIRDFLFKKTILFFLLFVDCFSVIEWMKIYVRLSYFLWTEKKILYMTLTMRIKMPYIWEFFTWKML